MSQAIPFAGSLTGRPLQLPRPATHGAPQADQHESPALNAAPVGAPVSPPAATAAHRRSPKVMATKGRDSVWVMNQRQHPGAPRVRLFAAISLSVISIAGSVLLVVTDGIGGNVRWAHHSGASAAPLLLVAGAITAVSIAHPPNGRHGLMRLVAVLAFVAWGIAQLAPDPRVAGALSDAAILLFVVDAACVVVPDARALLALRRRPVPATLPARSPAKTDRTVLPADPDSTPAGAPTPPCSVKWNPRCACTARAHATGIIVAETESGRGTPAAGRPMHHSWSRGTWARGPVRWHGGVCPRGLRGSGLNRAGAGHGCAARR